MTRWNDARVMAEHGFSVMPLHSAEGDKHRKPIYEWKHYQDEPAGEAQLDYWEDRHPDAYIGLITGALTGLVAVDCDNDEAIAYAQERGVWSPVRVRTRRGLHLLFRHPRDGSWYGPRVGSNSTGTDWPKFPGLDFRGDGSFVVAYNSPGYQLECDPGFDPFEIDDIPAWGGWPDLRPAEITVDLKVMDLSTARVLDGTTEWDRTQLYVSEHFPSAKIPSDCGNGRNMRVAVYAGELVRRGVYGEELTQSVQAFMHAFYEEALPDAEWKATCKSIEAAERRNHPDRVAENEAAKAAPPPAPIAVPTPSLLRVADTPALAASLRSTPMLVDPWLPKGGIVQVAGFTGHGKSMVVQHITMALANGYPSIGSFDIARPASVLYLDWENGRFTVSKRYELMKEAYGDPGDRFGLWTPWLERDDMPLNNDESRKKLTALIRLQLPDLVVIDTVRSAFPGLSENDADAWAPVNRLLMRLQAHGIAVVVLHHKNKPQSGGGFSREAGSTAQLNNIETQIFVTSVQQDKGRAEATSAIWDGSYDVPVFPLLQAKATDTLGADWRVSAAFEVRYGKVREWTEAHDPLQWMALVTNMVTGQERMIGSSSTKQKARAMASRGVPVPEIARLLMRPSYAIKEWVTT